MKRRASTVVPFRREPERRAEQPLGRALVFGDDEPQLPAWLAVGRSWDEWRAAWVAWESRQNSIATLARALDAAPKVAEAPFALTAPPNRSTDAAQRDLFS
jgi:hypothetical protein